MTLAEFIDVHRVELTRLVNGAIYRHDGNGGRGTVPEPAPTYDDDELEGWIMNDESLHDWARSEGVSV